MICPRYDKKSLRFVSAHGMPRTTPPPHSRPLHTFDAVIHTLESTHKAPKTA